MTSYKLSVKELRDVQPRQLNESIQRRKTKRLTIQALNKLISPDNKPNNNQLTFIFKNYESAPKNRSNQHILKYEEQYMNLMDMNKKIKLLNYEKVKQENIVRTNKEYQFDFSNLHNFNKTTHFVDPNSTAYINALDYDRSEETEYGFKRKNLENTKELVKTEAKNSVDFDYIINNKSKMMDEKLGLNKYPEIRDYDDYIIKNISNLRSKKERLKTIANIKTRHELDFDVDEDFLERYTNEIKSEFYSKINAGEKKMRNIIRRGGVSKKKYWNVLSEMLAEGGKHILETEEDEDEEDDDDKSKDTNDNKNCIFVTSKYCK